MIHRATKVIRAADLFCGAGGTSTGLIRACQSLGQQMKLLAINHWNIAIDTHTANHPYVDHLCEELDNINPRDLVPEGRLHFLVASPECTHHSNARGGRPINEQYRATAWSIIRWAEALYIDSILIENVAEFMSWGPCGVNGRPIKAKRGQTFQAFIEALRSLDYSVDYRILNAADYGDPTIRKRLFIQAKRGNRPITWPKPTHGPGAATPWRAAREIIDWSVEGKSILKRNKPLAPSTLMRIAAGLKKFGGPSAEPFLIVLRNHSSARSLDLPLPTITTSGAHFGLVQPFIVPLNHGKGDTRSYSIDNPMPTVTTVDAWGLIEPLIVRACHGAHDKGAWPVSQPLRTITTKEQFGLVTFEGATFDIRFRMLTPAELAKAMSFPSDYQFRGNREQKVRQIGNAVPVNLAEALCREILGDHRISSKAA